MPSLIPAFLDYYLIPRFCHRSMRENLLHTLPVKLRNYVEKRACYYNRLTLPCSLPQTAQTLSEYRYPLCKKKRFSTYFMDCYEVVRYFPESLHLQYLFGDVTHIPDSPTFVKSRPISDANDNSVLLKLDKRRHFKFVEDKLQFTQKKNMMVSRTTWANPSPQRRLLNEMFINHPMCDVGKTKTEENEDFPESVKPFMSKAAQLNHKFIACIEGVDVATNLKWVMSSNSVAVMPKPVYETWFMEGTLKPDYHYIEVKPDYSDLVDKITYYSQNPDKAQAIIDHAHEYVAPFKDQRLELIIQLRVAEKYFQLTQQM